MLKFKDPKTGINYKYAESSGTAKRRVESILTKEAGTINWIRSFDKEDVFCDIGANIGLYTIFAAPLVESVYAFEPHAGNVLALMQNVDLNNYKNVKVFNIPLSDKTGEVSPFGYNHMETGSSNHQLYSTNDCFIEYKPVMSLDDVFDRCELHSPNHIKIDVDGIELLVLEGMNNILSRPTTKTVLCEYNPEQSRGKLDEFMLQRWYKLEDKQLTAAGKKAIARGSNIDDIAHNRLYVRR